MWIKTASRFLFVLVKMIAIKKITSGPRHWAVPDPHLCGPVPEMSKCVGERWERKRSQVAYGLCREAEREPCGGTAWCERPVLPPEAMVMPGSVPPLRTVSGTVVLLQSRTMLMSVTRVITKDHVSFCGLYCMQPEVMLKSQGLAELALSLTGYHMVAPAVRQCENWLRPLPVQRGRIGKDVATSPMAECGRGELVLPLSQCS